MSISPLQSIRQYLPDIFPGILCRIKREYFHVVPSAGVPSRLLYCCFVMRRVISMVLSEMIWVGEDSQTISELYEVWGRC